MPFALALLEEALPLLLRERIAPDLPGLYKAAVLSWLHRDRRASAVGTDVLLKRLEEIAESVFTEFDTGTRRYDQLLVHAGILQGSGAGRGVFRHFSRVVYFVARVLENQLADFSAALLSRLNLVYMYNVNRFLIPLLLRESTKAVDSRPTSLEELGPNCRASVRGFLKFVEETHWRERQGYGVWTIKTAQDGTKPFEGRDWGGRPPIVPGT
jgi:hypothetical protein